jgi:hypothetical protein
MTHTTNPYIFLVCLWPLAFLAIWAIRNSFRDSRDEKLVEQSLAWPEAQGKVIQSKVAFAHVEVSYQYSVAGLDYTGIYKISLTPVAPDQYGRGATRMNSEAGQDVADYPAGANVIIRFNPQAPSQSVLYCSGEITRPSNSDSKSAAPKFVTLT